MRPEVERDFEYGRNFLPHMKQIAGLYLIGEAPFEEDARRATDLIVLRLDAIRIACRVRRPQFEARYGGEFTVRAERGNGTDTELTKIIEGWGDYMLYGFGAEHGPRLSSWVLGDLRVFRRWFNRRLALLPAQRTPGTLMRNGDGSSSFLAFSIADLPENFIVARQLPKLAMAA
jgi:hypothetical protein